MKQKIGKALFFIILFATEAMCYGGDVESVIAYQMNNILAVFGIPFLFILALYRFPAIYNFVLYALIIGTIGLIFESLYTYNQILYSPFVVKRFFYCGVALIAYFIAVKLSPFPIKTAVWLIFLFFFINQIILGKIFTYRLTPETRTQEASEALFMIIPFTYFFVQYLTKYKWSDLLKTIAVFTYTVLLMHRSVIASITFSALLIIGLSVLGRIPNSRLQIRRSIGTMLLLFFLAAPIITAISPTRVQAFVENIGGIFTPTEDETGSWRYEQTLYYWKKIAERPVFGWRYEGYEEGEVMENDGFSEKGTVIHSQYIDLLYNYGLFGLMLNLIIIVATLWALYKRHRYMTIDQLVLFSYIAGALVFGISYQFPVCYWSFVGLGMYHAFVATPAPDPYAEQLAPMDFSYPQFGQHYDQHSHTRI
ncbi:O-antigen ligase family protein [Fibrisoma montanum]|uniref:O-antigen ligase family protein n=1 Tax=Fibrisoma montanum TaxID=2305895 RepID=A0A418M8T4_9BACT|nr:O-antigen ligase family protein [Fibrisoma montanum]RIV22499.1 O-antigen ligase family protein [Fibrisoma montanum]